MYSEGTKFICKDRTEFLKLAFGLDRTMSTWRVRFGQYRILILPIYENKEEYIADLNKNVKHYYNYFDENGKIIEKNNEEEWKKEEEGTTLFVREIKRDDEKYDYIFMGFYGKNGLVSYENKRFYHERKYQKLSYDKNDIILFCCPKVSSKQKYEKGLYFDFYRLEKTEGLNLSEYKRIEKDELNNSDYIFENMKLLAMEHSMEKDENERNLEFLNYSELEEKLFLLAYSTIEPNLVQDKDYLQRQILIESSELVDRFIKYMED